MKKMLFFIAILATVIVSCKNKSELKSIPGETKIVEYCSGNEFESDGKYFRSSATGESRSREAAKKIARSNAEDKMGRTVKVTVKSVTDNYVNSTKFNNIEEVTETFNNLARSVVDISLDEVKVICEETTKNEKGFYVNYVCIEYDSEVISSKMNNTIQNEEKILSEWNYERFKETFEQEMLKLNK
jgi:hypothetical protein